MASEKAAGQNLATTTGFGPWLRRERKGKDRIQRQLAAAVNMDPSHLGKVERGERLPTKKQAIAIAKALGIAPSDARAQLIASRVIRECSGDLAAAHTAATIVCEAVEPLILSAKRGKSQSRANQ